MDDQPLVLTSDGDTVVHLAGELDAHTAERLQTVVSTRLGDDEPEVVLDLGGLGFVDSTGLRTLVDSGHRLREAGGSLTLTNVPDRIRRVFEIAGLDQHFAGQD